MSMNNVKMSRKKLMQREFADVIQKISEKEGGEVSPSRIMEAFEKHYLKLKEPFEFTSLRVEDDQDDDDTRVVLNFKYKGEEVHSEAGGNGPIDAAKIAVRQCVPSVDVTILNYDEHALSEGSHAKAACYIQMKDNRSGNVTFGVGVSSNITRASIRAMFSALNRLSEMENY